MTIDQHLFKGNRRGSKHAMTGKNQGAWAIRGIGADNDSSS